MKFLFDLFPVILFFAAFSLTRDIYLATAVAMAATVGQVAFSWFKHRKVEIMQWVSLGLIVVLGGATLLLHDKSFIMWKPTVLYWLMGGTLLVGQWLFNKNFVRTLMGGQLSLPDAAWRGMNASWVAFFAAMGALNLWIAYQFDTDTWVNFKLFGGMGLMFLFVLGQAFFISRFVKDAPAQPSEPRA